MNFGFDFTKSNPGLFRQGQFIDLTSPVEHTTYSPQFANNMAFGDTSAYGRDNLRLGNQRAQYFQLQTTSIEQKTQKPEKRNKRKKNAALRRAIEKKYIQKRRQELEVERCQVLLAAINQEQNSTRRPDLKDHKPYSENASTFSEARVEEALELNGRQSQLTQGASPKEYNKKINIVSTTKANQDIIISKELRVMARKKAKVIPNPSKRRRRGKDLDEINSMVLNAAHRTGHILTTNMGNSVTSWNRADSQILAKLSGKDEDKNLQFSGIVPKPESLSEEKQMGQYSIAVLNHQEPIQTKGIVLSHTNPRKKQKKAAKPNSKSASCLNKTLANEVENLNLPKNIPVIDLSSPVLAKNVLSMTGGTNNICPKKKRPAKSKKKQVCNTTTIDTTVPKPEERPMSKKAIKKQIRRIKRLEREAANQKASNDDNNHVKTEPDKIDIPDQSRHGNETMNQGEQEKHEEQEKREALEQHVEQEKLEPSLKEIPGYLEPYKTDTEKEVLSLMRELLGIVR